MNTTHDKSNTPSDSKTNPVQDADSKTQGGGETSNASNSKSSESSAKGTKKSETQKGGPLYTFFLDGLKDIHFAEHHLMEALKKMQKAATTKELEEAFEDHYLVTQKHVSRLEKVFKSIDEPLEKKKCDAIIGIVKEAESAIEGTEEGSMTRDAALIISAQKAEHYEIASYGGLAALAETLELKEASELLHKTLQEEEHTDELLSDIAESHINFAAVEDAS